MSKGDWRARVYLVGAGPGDPGLLTRRGEQCLRRADLVLYDNLTNPELLKFTRPEAEKIYVGKKAGEKRFEQEVLNSMLVEAAQAGRIVVRLKGGDSFVFGRGGEEAEALLAAGIKFEVVPGVTSAVAAPALAGIPVTHRGINTVLHILTGYEDPDDPTCSVPWKLFGRGGSTIVILMGQAHIDKILRRLHTAGLPDETPLATVRHGSYADQKSVRMTLGEARARSDAAWMPPPAITIIGGVAGMDAGLNWFESRPLFSRRVLLTRPAESDDAILADLREAGAQCENIPVVRIEPRKDVSENLKRQLDLLRAENGWLVLPSPAAIRHFFRALSESNLDVRAVGGIRIAAVGASSANVLKEFNIVADFIPDEALGASLAASLPLDSNSKRVLVAGSASSRPELREALAARGVEVAHLALYDTLPDADGARDVVALVERGEVDAVVFFSPSAVRSVAEAAKNSSELLRLSIWIAIGPTTAAEMTHLGFAIRATADKPTADALVNLLSL